MCSELPTSAAPFVPAIGATVTWNATPCEPRPVMRTGTLTGLAMSYGSAIAYIATADGPACVQVARLLFDPAFTVRRLDGEGRTAKSYGPFARRDVADLVARNASAKHSAACVISVAERQTPEVRLAAGASLDQALELALRASIRPPVDSEGATVRPGAAS